MSEKKTLELTGKLKDLAGKCAAVLGNADKVFPQFKTAFKAVCDYYNLIFSGNGEEMFVVVPKGKARADFDKACRDVSKAITLACDDAGVNEAIRRTYLKRARESFAFPKKKAMARKQGKPGTEEDTGTGTGTGIDMAADDWKDQFKRILVLAIDGHSVEEVLTVVNTTVKAWKRD
jgi:hypothetical protein